MREIRFRGRRVDGGGWVYGNLIKVDNPHIAGGMQAWIVPEKIKPEDVILTSLHRINTPAFTVDPETVGQFIGLHDKNGREIYEGDILRHDDPNWGYGGTYDKEHDGYLRTIVPGIDVLLRNGLDDGDYEPQFMQHWEVIGNIHENSGLCG